MLFWNTSLSCILRSLRRKSPRYVFQHPLSLLAIDTYGGVAWKMFDPEFERKIKVKIVYPSCCNLSLFPTFTPYVAITYFYSIPPLNLWYKSIWHYAIFHFTSPMFTSLIVTRKYPCNLVFHMTNQSATILWFIISSVGPTPDTVNSSEAAFYTLP